MIFNKEAKAIKWKKDIVNEWCWNIWTSSCKEIKKNLDTDITLVTKVKSKQLTDLNVKHKTPKLLEYNKGGDLGDSEFGHNFLETTPNA